MAESTCNCSLIFRIWFFNNLAIICTGKLNLANIFLSTNSRISAFSNFVMQAKRSCYLGENAL